MADFNLRMELDFEPDKKTLEFAMTKIWQFEKCCKDTKTGRIEAEAYNKILKILEGYLNNKKLTACCITAEDIAKVAFTVPEQATIEETWEAAENAMQEAYGHKNVTCWGKGTEQVWRKNFFAWQ